MLLRTNQEASSDLNIVFETNDAGLLASNKITTLRVGFYRNRREQRWAFIELVDDAGNTQRMWMDAAGLQETISGLVEVMPEIV